MRVATLLAALLLLACPMTARAAPPTASCPDILLGDSLAVGMGPYARAAGFEVIARTGIGLSWLRSQTPRCARRVVVVVGTNDLRGIDPWSAEAYPDRLAAIMSRWPAQQITWATPGCFPRDASLERGSEALDRALAREPLVRVGAGRNYMRVHSGRVARCSYLSGDGIHPTGNGYRAWWANLSQSIGPEPEGAPYREEPAIREASARPDLRWTRQATSARHTRQVQQARASRPGRSIQQVRPSRPTRSVQQARLAARSRAPQPPSATRQARPGQRLHAERQARPSQTTRPTAQARRFQQARPAPRQEVRQLRTPPAPRLVAGNPIRRT